MMIKMNFEVHGDASEAREFLAALVASLNASAVKPAIRVEHREPAPLVFDKEAFLEAAKPTDALPEAPSNVSPIEAQAPATEVEAPKRTRGRPRLSAVPALAPVAPVANSDVPAAPVAAPVAAAVVEAPAEPVAAPAADVTLTEATALFKQWIGFKGKFNGKSRVAHIMDMLTKYGASSATNVPENNRAAFLAELRADIAAELAGQSAAPVKAPEPAAANALFD